MRGRASGKGVQRLQIRWPVTVIPIFDGEWPRPGLVCSSSNMELRYGTMGQRFSSSHFFKYKVSSSAARFEMR